MNLQRFSRLLIASLLLISAGAFSIRAQNGYGRDAAQPIDGEYTKKIREYTTESFFNSPLTDYLPASPNVPTPKAVLGDVAGAPGKLPYAEEVYRYMRMLEKASPRVKVFSIGTTEEGREMIAVAIASESLLAKLDENRARLTKLADLLPKPSPAQTLLKEPRQDFPISAQVSYLKVQDGGSAVLGLVGGDASAVTVADAGGKKVVKVVVAAQAVGEDGKVAAFAEEARTAEVAADGSFAASFRMGLKPGKYTLKAAALDEKSGKGSLATTPIEVPDLNTGALSMASLMIVRSVDELPENAPDDSRNPYAAFLLGRLRLVPYFGGVLTKKDAPSFFYQFYDLKIDPLTGKASGVVSLSVLKEGKTPVAKAPDQPFDQPVGGTMVGPVPLDKYDPGSYVVQLKVTDKVAGKEKMQEVRFELKP